MPFRKKVYWLVFQGEGGCTDLLRFDILTLIFGSSSSSQLHSFGHRHPCMATRKGGLGVGKGVGVQARDLPSPYWSKTRFPFYSLPSASPHLSKVLLGPVVVEWIDVNRNLQLTYPFINFLYTEFNIYESIRLLKKPDITPCVHE